MNARIDALRAAVKDRLLTLLAFGIAIAGFAVAGFVLVGLFGLLVIGIRAL